MSATTPPTSPQDGRVSFPEKDLPLRRDVRWLGRLLGKLLQELGDETLFPNVEVARKLSRQRRRGQPDARKRLSAILADLDATEGFELVRAFSAYFGLVNMAERVHRIRRRTDRLRSGNVQPGGLRDVFLELKNAGISADDAEQAVLGSVVEPVMTAHPTEAVRRTLLRRSNASRAF